MSKRILIAIIIVIFPLVIYAAMPNSTGFVTDAAGVLDKGTRSNLEKFLRSFEAQTGVEIAVATVPSLDGRPIEDYAVDLYKRWGIGKKGKDNGILFLIAPTERRMRIEVGYGLEGAINDALAGRIMDETVLPRFKEGDIPGGIAMGTISIVDAVVEKENLGFDPSREIAEYEQLAQPGGPLHIFGKILLLIVMGFIFIRHPWLFLFFLAGRGGSIGGRGFGGGFGGFGGGLSGGGGASRGW